MQKIYIKGIVTKTERGTYKVLASTAAIDRHGESIDQAGWDLTNYKLNPVFLWAHDYSLLPIAKCIGIEVTDKGLEAEFEFASAEGNPMAQQVKTLYDEGFLNAVSVGLIPKMKKGNIITQAELLEISFVPVPANQEALRLAIKGVESNDGLTDDDKTIVKSWLEKGEIADQISASEAWEMKWENWEKMTDVLSAFWSVYFDEMTPVEDFNTLLGETITLLQGLLTAPSEPIEEGMVAKAISADTLEKYNIAITEKAGRTLSSKTLESIDKAITAMSEASTVLGELRSSADNQDGKSMTKSEEKQEIVEEEKKDEPIEEKADVTVLTNDDLKALRETLVSNNKTRELALSIVNNHMRAKGLLK